MRKQRFLLLRRARPLLCHEWKKFPSMNHHLSVGAHEAAYSLPLAAGICMASFMHNATLGSFGSLGVQDASLTVTCTGVFVEQYYMCVYVCVWRGSKSEHVRKVTALYLAQVCT